MRLNDEKADQLAIAIGQRLVAYRVALNLKQQEVAAMTGISRSQLSRYEAGTTIPSVPVLITLSEFYGVAMDRVGRGDDEVQFIDLRLRKAVADVEAKGPAYCRLLNELIEEVIYDGGKKKKDS